MHSQGHSTEHPHTINHPHTAEQPHPTQHQHPTEHPHPTEHSHPMEHLKSMEKDRGTSWDRHYQPAQLHKLPPVVDLRPRLNDERIEVYHQGHLQSCTANAICTAWRYAQALIDPGFTPSRLFLYYNERLAEGTTSKDPGAHISDGCRSLATYGVCSEVTWPYVEAKEPVKPTEKTYHEARGHVIHTPAKISNNNLDHLKHSLAENKPFVVGIAFYSGFKKEPTTSTGIVSMPGHSKSSEKPFHHAVLCVGYDDHRKVWIFRNSWGPHWGDKGHFYLPYEYLSMEDHLASDFWNLATDHQEHRSSHLH